MSGVFDRFPVRLATLLAAALLAGCGDGGPTIDTDGGPGGADGAAVGRPDAAAAPGSEYVFDDGALRTYELVVADADWQWLQDDALLEQYVPATLRFEGQEIGPIGVRYKGGYGTLRTCCDSQGNRLCPKISMKLELNEYVDELRFYRLKRLDFHSMKSDPSRMHDRLAYALFGDVGVYAPRAVCARLVVNGELLVEAFGMPTWDAWPVSCASILLFNGIRGRAPACDAIVRSSSTALWDRYAAATGALLDGAFQIDAMFDRLDRWSVQIADAVAEDPSIHGVTEWELAVGDMKAALITSRSRLEQAVRR